MHRAVGWHTVFAASVLFSASTGAGQTVGDSTGTIDGRVIESATGTELPGVQVCVAGRALMTTRCTESDSDGSYRIPALPPGEYVLTFSLPGFEPVRSETVRVGLGETRTVPVTIDITRQRQQITVEDRALDRIATTRSASFTAEELASLPGSRSMGSILQATDSIVMSRHDVGGSTAIGIGTFAAYGTSGFNRPTLEGINVSGMNPLAFSLDYGSFDEVVVGLGAFGPEWPSPGVYVQMVTKSGGNRYRGSVYAATETESLQARNVDADQIARGAAAGEGISATEANRLDSYHDLNADVGGFLRRDRLWWYASGRDQQVAAWRVTFPSTPIETRAWTGSGKVEARVGDDDRAIVFAHVSRSQQPIRLDAFLLSAETALNPSESSTTEQRARGLVWKAEWSGGIEGKLFVEARAGQFLANRGEFPNGGLGVPRTEDQTTFRVNGGNREWLEEQRRSQLTGSISYGRRSHLFKAGGEVSRLTAVETWVAGYEGDVLHEFANGVPSSVYLFQTPSRSENGQWWSTGFANDTWQATSRVTLNLGLRFDHFRVFLPEQHHPASRFNPRTDTFPAVDNLIDWNVLAPRVGISHSLGDNQRTILRSSYSLYWLPASIDLGFNANPNARTWYDRHAWLDKDGDNEWDPDETGTLRERRGGTEDVLDPDLKLSYVHEVTARVEHEAPGGVVLQTGFVWRGVRQQGARQPGSWPFEAFTGTVTRVDPGPDGQLGTADDGGEVLLYDVPAGLAGARGMIVRNVPDAGTDDITWEVTTTRPFRNRWSLDGSFAHTWYRDQASGYLGQGVRNNGLPLTPNDFIHTDARGRHVFGIWTAKLRATYETPWQFRVTTLLRHQSGQPFARTFRTQVPNYGTLRVLAEPIGTRRQDNVTILDVRVDRAFRVKGTRLTGFLEVFNALNANPEQNINWASSNQFLRPLAIVPPRIARFGLQYDW